NCRVSGQAAVSRPKGLEQSASGVGIDSQPQSPGSCVFSQPVVPGIKGSSGLISRRPGWGLDSAAPRIGSGQRQESESRAPAEVIVTLVGYGQVCRCRFVESPHQLEDASPQELDFPDPRSAEQLGAYWISLESGQEC